MQDVAAHPLLSSSLLVGYFTSKTASSNNILTHYKRKGIKFLTDWKLYFVISATLKLADGKVLGLQILADSTLG